MERKLSLFSCVPNACAVWVVSCCVQIVPHIPPTLCNLYQHGGDLLYLQVIFAHSTCSPLTYSADSSTHVGSRLISHFLPKATGLPAALRWHVA